MQNVEVRMQNESRMQNVEVRMQKLECRMESQDLPEYRDCGFLDLRLMTIHQQSISALRFFHSAF